LNGFPFGLWTARRLLNTAGHIVVWPRTFSLPAAAFQGGAIFDDRMDGHVTGASGELSGVRQYRRGDSLRRVHWGQTAKHDRFIVCQRQAPSAPQIQVILHAHAASYSGDGADGSLAWAVRVAASLLMRFVADGANVELVAGTGAPLAAGSQTRLATCFDHLALMPIDADCCLLDVLRSSHCRGFQGDAQLVIASQAAAESAASALPQSAGLRWVLLDGGDQGHACCRPAPGHSVWFRRTIRIEDPATIAQSFADQWEQTCHA
jgi:uncharacterized protein (DUF58 family)